MKLSAYLEKRNETASAFAERIGRNVSTVSRLARGLTDPDRETMNRIMQATVGRVKPNDFYIGKSPEDTKVV